MLSVNDAKRVAVLNFLRCAHGRGKAREAQPAKPPGNLEQCEAIERRMVRYARNPQISWRTIETVGRNAIRVVIPIEPDSHVVHHGGTNGPGMPDGDAAGRVEGDSLSSVAAVGQSRQRRLLEFVGVAN